MAGRGADITYHRVSVAAPDTPRSLTGMKDVLPATSRRWRLLIDAFLEALEASGYAQIRTPVLEELAVFQRLGVGTDVVSKEMYAFEDRDGTMVALRPESTAGVARSFVEHHPILPWKVSYISEHFRHEKPQAGRFRQHHQIGAECFGSPDPDVDVEMIVGLWDFYASLGLRRVRLEINSIGDPESRRVYAEDLDAFLRGHASVMHPDDAAKIGSHPLRILDSKNPETVATLGDAPTLWDRMGEEARAHAERVRDGLDAAGVPFEVNPRLVRGLDYYTHTVFEIISDAIDASQSTIGGGGRYDGLVAALGGPDTPGFGYGSGVERVLLACDAEQAFLVEENSVDVFVVGFGGDQRDVRDITTELRRAGLKTDRAFDARSPKAQMKAADRSGAEIAVLSGDDEREANAVTLRSLRTDGEQRTVARSEMCDEIRKLLT